jgi:serine/threonine-protein kinase RsbW
MVSTRSFLPPGMYVPGDLRTYPGHYRSVRTFADMHALLEQFTSELRVAGFSVREATEIRLALNEAITNGLRHGNGGDPGKQVHVCYNIRPDQVVLHVEDEGAGFNPDALPNPLAQENLEHPSGRGVFLMQRCMSWVHFNERGNCVTMGRRKQ